MTQNLMIISSEYKRAHQVCENTESAFFSNNFKDEREWIVLGAACQLMEKGKIQPPYHATKSESPDFQLFDQSGKKLGGIEIAEVLRPNYARHQHFKDAEKQGDQGPQAVGPPIKEPWTSMRSVMQKKAAKRYPANTALLLYFDIWVFAFPSWEPVHLQLLEEHARFPFQGCDQFSEVLVLDSGMRNLVRLSPKTELVYSTSVDT